MKRTEIINHFIEKNGYDWYLEVGVHNGINFNNVKCKHKVGVDPDPTSKATVFKTSDEFFKENTIKFQIIFLDGLHLAIQLYKDILNSLACLNKGGVILLHDMLPPNKLAQDVPRVQGEWTGDCWMAFVWLRATRRDLEMYTIDTDYGVGVIQKGSQELLEIKENITYENFEINKNAWLNLVGVEALSRCREVFDC
jgi:hypothetical protein